MHPTHHSPSPRRDSPRVTADDRGSINTRDESFDFDAHSSRAVEEYRAVVGQYEDFALMLERLLRTLTDSSAALSIHTLESRAKDVESFRGKAGKASTDNPNLPKYPNPLQEITDLAAVRIITFFLENVLAFEDLLSSQFEVIEKTDKSSLLEREDRFGYHSVHYIVTLGEQRLALGEYARFRGLKAEIQVRTILQHAWAEIEHDVQYKAQSALPTQIRRRFMALAGVLEMADREFQEIWTEDERLRRTAIEAVQSGNLTAVEITADALKEYLDQKYGPDGRMTQTAYNFTVTLLRNLGFRDLDQVDAAISGYDDDKVSRVATNSRQGQLTRLDLVLLAALGTYFIDKSPLSRYSSFRHDRENDLELMRRGGIEIGRGLAAIGVERD